MTARCPDKRLLQSLLESEGGADADGLHSHLDSCAECRRTLESLAGDRTAWANTATLAEPIRRESALQELIERLKTDEPHQQDADEISFLVSSEKPGVLGLLGAYEVLEVTGRGAMGIVFKACDPGLNRVVALKVLSPRLATSASARKRFVREGRAAAAVCHENIVPIFAVEELGGLPCLVMQHIGGESLQDRLDRLGPLEVAEIVSIGLQTAQGLAAAHAQGLIHRDIKPANLLLSGTNGGTTVKITDFGLARTVDDVQLTQQGALMGTPEYMAPEQARGEAVDARADLFSLGSVLYAMATGFSPFRGPSAMAVLRRVSDETPTPVRTINPAIPEWLALLIERLLAKNPGERFASAAEVAELLQGYQAHLTSQTPAPSLPVAPRPVENAAKEKGLRGRGIVLLLTTLALLAIFATLFVRHSPLFQDMDWRVAAMGFGGMVSLAALAVFLFRGRRSD